LLWQDGEILLAALQGGDLFTGGALKIHAEP
jgi:hypothetical protein